jgi:hypothetical protein
MAPRVTDLLGAIAPGVVTERRLALTYSGEMPQGQAIEFIVAGAPLGSELCNEGDEAFIVGGFQEMEHLMENDIFEALAWFFREF